jgi:hypothetical protein
MDWSVFLSAFLGSSVVVALVGGLVSLRMSERQIAIENITKERTKWRERIREKAVALHASASVSPADTARLKELHVEVALLLNPDDDEDIEIIKCIKALTSGEFSKAEEITNRLSLLLKHDWQRAKWEAKPVWWRSPCEPVRIKYAMSKYAIRT